MEFLFGFIGCGNMGSALCRAVAKKYSNKEIAVFDRHPEKLDALKDVATICNSANEVAKKSKFLFIGAKPQGYENTFNAIKQDLKNNKDVIIVSMAAGVSISGVLAYADGNYPVVRIMPNTPCQIGSGVILYTCNDKVLDVDKKTFVSALDGAGLVDEIDEEKIDVASCLSGCGPAFVYMYIDALKQAAINLGLSEEKAHLYAIKTVEGSATNAYSTGKPLSELIKAVCSPGGTTIEGVKSFEENDLYGITEKAITASYKRTLELKK